MISHQPWDNASAVRTGPGCWAYPDMLGKAHGHKPVLVKALHLMRFPLHHSRGFHSFSHLTLTRIWIRRGETHYRGGEPTVVRGGQSALWRLGDRLRAANLGARPRQVRQRVFLRCHLFGIKKCHHFTKTGSGQTERTRSKLERRFWCRQRRSQRQDLADHHQQSRDQGLSELRGGRAHAPRWHGALVEAGNAHPVPG